MRKSKYDQSSLPVQDSKSIDSDDNISKIENRVDFETELVNLTNQIKDIKDVIQELKQIKAFVDASVLTFEESAQVLNAAVKTSDNIPDTISRAIIQAENTVVNVKLSDEDKSILTEYRNKLIEEEKSLFEKQITDFKVVAVAGELLDRIAAIEQFARRAVNVRNGALAGGRAHEARVVCELSRLLVERRNVDDFRTDGAGQNRQANFRRTVGKHEFY